MKRANATELGLAAGVFSNDYYTLQRVGDALEAGTIYHNCYNLGQDLKFSVVGLSYRMQDFSHFLYPN